MAVTELDAKADNVVSLIATSDPGQRHVHLDKLHALVSEYALRGNGIPRPLRQLQEELTNEAIEARFDNLPV